MNLIPVSRWHDKFLFGLLFIFFHDAVETLGGFPGQKRCGGDRYGHDESSSFLFYKYNTQYRFFKGGGEKIFLYCLFEHANFLRFFQLRGLTD